FGAMVEILPGKEGLVHVSQMSEDFVDDPSTVVSIGQKIMVKVMEIDEKGRINLTMLLEGEKKGGTGSRGPQRDFGRQPRFEKKPYFNPSSKFRK
ncbi:S1 RNA-binding domain-containing protein, partial [Patescibacteria group bacterium]|nr:S1 RNA-binding domain-containing protein [Patescibacteria group bacterium]